MYYTVSQLVSWVYKVLVCLLFLWCIDNVMVGYKCYVDSYGIRIRHRCDCERACCPEYSDCEMLAKKRAFAREKRNDQKSTKIHLPVHQFMRLPESGHPRALVASATRLLARVRRHDVRRSREEILALRIIVVLGARTHIMCV